MHAMLEARRSAPSVLHLPHVALWWATAPAPLRATLQMVLADLPAELPVLLLGSCDQACCDLDPEVILHLCQAGCGHQGHLAA